MNEAEGMKFLEARKRSVVYAFPGLTRYDKGPRSLPQLLVCEGRHEQECVKDDLLLPFKPFECANGHRTDLLSFC